MVRALLDGRKTMTRRIIKPQPRPLRNAGPFYRPHPVTSPRDWLCLLGDSQHCWTRVLYAVGDRLWVREAISAGGWNPPIYRVDEEAQFGGAARENNIWSPSIHMPRWASRLTLTVTEVKVERLQDISEDDAEAEGAYECENGWSYGGSPLAGSTARGAFYCLWNSIHGPGAWDTNPWVAAIRFTVAKGNIDA